MHVITQWFVAGSARRQGELDACLVRNLENPGVAAVHLLLESGDHAKILHRHVLRVSTQRAAATETQRKGNGGSGGGGNGFASSLLAKAAVVVLGKRATFKDLFTYANDFLPGRACLVMNADLFAAYSWPASILPLPRTAYGSGDDDDDDDDDGSEDVLEGRVLALLRWEWVWPGMDAVQSEEGPMSGGGAESNASDAAPYLPPWSAPWWSANRSTSSSLSGQEEEEEAEDREASPPLSLLEQSSASSPVFALGSTGAFMARIDSQDAWLFRAPLPSAVVEGSDFFLGLPRCDNRLAELFASEGGLQVENPGLLLATFHVESQKHLLAQQEQEEQKKNGDKDEEEEEEEGGGDEAESSGMSSGGANSKLDKKQSYAGADLQVRGAVRYVPLAFA